MGAEQDLNRYLQTRSSVFCHYCDKQYRKVSDFTGGCPAGSVPPRVRGLVAPSESERALGNPSDQMASSHFGTTCDSPEARAIRAKHGHLFCSRCQVFSNELWHHRETQRLKKLAAADLEEYNSAVRTEDFDEDDFPAPRQDQQFREPGEGLSHPLHRPSCMF